MNTLALVTPLKDEFKILPKLFDAIEAQSIKISIWIIIENDSHDGSKEFLSTVAKPAIVEEFHVLNYSHPEKEYQLGKKYSTIIHYGFNFLKTKPIYENLDFIGILDADCLPEPDYYLKLLNQFKQNPKLGIASGIIKYDIHTIEKSNSDHARGGCRIWRIECFKDSPYEIGLSADSTSSAKAIINGWQVQSFDDAVVFSRKAGSRYISTYPGRSAYYRHIPFYYVLLKSILLLIRCQPKKSLGYFVGYLQGLLRGDERLSDKTLIHYYRNILFRKISH